ncbi:hypothetical protein AALO_G00164750 [Alosa alosa]|uniref:Uncharacterized protein n=1 Tax=Alosa alosa TaxID=278164 RepID=A0AAV6GB68_9TELE|nr:hypothetical protein AALO_G00164750 [Alosa alosa]
MEDFLVSNDMSKHLQGPVQCVENPRGNGVRVYMDQTFYNCPLHQIPVQCEDNPEGRDIMVYYDKTFFMSPQARTP